MSHRNSRGNIVFEAPTSTLEIGSLERNTRDIDLFWPYQSGSVPGSLMTRFREKDRLEFFCPREILFHGLGEDKPVRVASQDDVWGVRFVWPYEAKKGERYVFTFVGKPAIQPGSDTVPENIEMPDFVLVNGVCLHKREIDTDLYVTVEYVAPEDGPMTVTFVKDRFYCIDHYDRVTRDWAPISAPTCHIYLHMQLEIGVACEHFGPTDLPATTGEQFTLPEGMRTFYAPGAYKWVSDQDILPYDYPPVVKPEYPTAEVYYNQFHDMYLDDAAFENRPERLVGIVGKPEVIKDLVRMSLDNGINCFVQRADVLDAIDALGLKDAPITIEYSGCLIKRVVARPDTDEEGNPIVHLRGLINKTIKLKPGETFELTADMERAARKEEGTNIANILRRFPNALVVYRLNEFSGCQYLHINESKEGLARVGRRPWYDYAKIADIINHEAMDELFAEAREVDASRFIVGANVQTSYLMSHPLHCGADFTIDKTIGRNQVNILVATSRGVNTCFNRWIGLQHDAWGGLHYNYDSAGEIEAVHRSFFFNGGIFHDAEFQGLAVTRDGKAAFNLKGMAWIKVTRMVAIHPRRGRQRVKIAFMRGSDNIWGWGYPGIPHAYDGCDPADPKEHVDFNLLDVAFPKYGNWMSFNSERWITGTPYGPCDVLPWDAPVDSLKRYRAVVMVGANRVEEADWQHYIDYVKSGGVLVMGLYQLFPPTRERVYLKQDVSDLLGVKLGSDKPIWDHPTDLEREAFVSEHYNKVELAGAEVIEALPNGDPLLTRFRLGDGEAYFFTTDRLTTVKGVADKLVRSLFDPHVPVRLSPDNDRVEIAISENGDLRIITLMDHGRDCLPTDAGEDTGPYSGTAALDLDNLGLPADEYEVLQAVTDEKITKLETQPIPYRQEGRVIEVSIENMGNYCELVLGPKGRTEHAFFWEAK